MKKIQKGAGVMIALALMLMLSGCSSSGEKISSFAGVYCATTILSFLLLGAYCWLIKKKDSWMLLLFSSILITNLGYLSLSLSKNTEEALLANRIAYLGSVFLPLAMLMIVVRGCGIRYKKWMCAALVVFSVAVYIIAASPGYLDIYYRSASLEMVNGVAILKKEYGPWHRLYLVYLLVYFAAMVAVLLYVHKKRKLRKNMQSVILVAAVFGNIGVWLLEQLVDIGFEMLSVSYIISELFLLGLYLMVQEMELGRYHLPESIESAEPTLRALLISDKTAEKESAEELPQEEPVSEEDKAFAASCEFFKSQLGSLTPTERIIYDYYLEGKSTKEILQLMSITENTLKFHNKNIYSKLGVSSRRQLTAIAAAIVKKN